MPYKQKTVAFVIQNFGLGGAERQAILLAHYVKANLDLPVLFIVQTEGSGHAKDLLVEYDIPFVVFPFHWAKDLRYLAGRFWRLHLLLKAHKVGLLLPFSILPNRFCGLSKVFPFSVPVIWNQRDSGFGEELGSLRKAVFRHCDYFVANSTGGLRYVEAQFDVSEKACFIRNQIDGPRPLQTREETRTQWNFLARDFVCLMIANITSMKDHLTLVKAWRRVVDEMGTECRPCLVLAGKHYEAESVKALVFDLKLWDHVLLPGTVMDVDSLCLASDLSVFSSLDEGTPNGILEAMRNGLCVVCTDIPGNRDAVGEDYPFLVPIQEPERMAEAIVNLIRDGETRRKWGERNRNRALELYMGSRNHEQYVGIMKKVAPGIFE